MSSSEAPIVPLLPDIITRLQGSLERDANNEERNIVLSGAIAELAKVEARKLKPPGGDFICQVLALPGLIMAAAIGRYVMYEYLGHLLESHFILDQGDEHNLGDCLEAAKLFCEAIEAEYGIPFIHDESYFDRYRD